MDTEHCHDIRTPQTSANIEHCHDPLAKEITIEHTFHNNHKNQKKKSKAFSFDRKNIGARCLANGTHQLMLFVQTWISSKNHTGYNLAMALEGRCAHAQSYL